MKLKILIRKLKTASTFSLVQWQVIGAAYFFLLKSQFLLFFSPLYSIEKVLSKSHPSSNRRLLFTQKKLISFFQIAERYQLKKPNCLGISLAKCLFLTYYGYPTQVQIGVLKQGGGLKAHAWCEENSDFHRLEVTG